MSKSKRSLLFSIILFFSFSTMATAQSLGELLRKSSDPVVGNPNGKVTVVEFFDYQCGYCVDMAPTMTAVIKANPQVRFVFKEFPIRGNLSILGSRAALAANKQGKYYPFSHALLTSSESLSESNITSLAKKLGLNVTELKKDMNSASVSDQINSNLSLGNELQVSGTPAFFIAPTNASNNNQVNFVLGEMSQSELQDAINKAG